MGVCMHVIFSFHCSYLLLWFAVFLRGQHVTEIGFLYVHNHHCINSILLQIINVRLYIFVIFRVGSPYVNLGALNNPAIYEELHHDNEAAGKI
jgi:hypothetical protein